MKSKNKKGYLPPVLETVRIDAQDVLTLSDGTKGAGRSKSFTEIWNAGG